MDKFKGKWHLDKSEPYTNFVKAVKGPKILLESDVYFTITPSEKMVVMDVQVGPNQRKFDLKWNKWYKGPGMIGRMIKLKPTWDGAALRQEVLIDELPELGTLDVVREIKGQQMIQTTRIGDDEYVYTYTKC